MGTDVGARMVSLEFKYKMVQLMQRNNLQHEVPVIAYHARFRMHVQF